MVVMKVGALALVDYPLHRLRFLALPIPGVIVFRYNSLRAANLSATGSVGRMLIALE